MSIPYTYFIKHKRTGEFYYGVKFGKDANPDTFWIDYFTTSKAVHTIIERDGKDSFDAHVRKIFKESKEAYMWEQRVISKIINHEKCLNAALGFSFNANKNRNIIGASGLNNYQQCAAKARLTMLNDIDENGYNTYQRNAHKVYESRDEDYRVKKSERSAKTMREKGIYDMTSEKHKMYQNEIMSSGLTRAQETGKKVSKTRKMLFESGVLTGPLASKNPMAKKIKIFNENDELMFTCHGDFDKVCTTNHLPKSFLKKSYRNNGLKFCKMPGMTQDFFEANKQFSGWYAKEILNG